MKSLEWNSKEMWDWLPDIVEVVIFEPSPYDIFCHSKDDDTMFYVAVHKSLVTGLPKVYTVIHRPKKSEAGMFGRFWRVNKAKCIWSELMGVDMDIDMTLRYLDNSGKWWDAFEAGLPVGYNQDGSKI